MFLPNKARPYPEMRLLSRTLLLFALLSFAAILLVVHAAAQPIDQDEEQYMAAAHLARSMALYRDFLYLQPPTYPLTVAFALSVFDGWTGPFMIGRMVSAAAAVGALISFFLVAHRLAGTTAAAVLSAAFVTSPLLLRAFGSTRNDVLAIFLGLASTAFLVRSDATKPLAVFTSGLCAALAVGTKLTSAFVPLAGLVFLFAYQRSSLVPYVFGGAVGSLPLLYFGISAPDQFFYGLFTYHVTAPVQFYTESQQGDSLTLHGRIAALARALGGEPQITIATLFIVVTLFFVRDRLRKKNALILCTTALAPIFVLVPNPWSLIYLQPMLPFLLLSCAALWPSALLILSRRFIAMFGTLAIVLFAVQITKFGLDMVQRTSRPTALAETRQLSDAVASRIKDKAGLIATLYPLLVLDAGLRFYPEVSTGIYFYRSAHHLPASRVKELNGMSSQTLPRLLSNKPPAAVLSSNHPLDAPLTAWAEENAFVETPLPEWRRGPYDTGWRPRLYLSPDENTARHP